MQKLQTDGVLSDYRYQLESTGRIFTAYFDVIGLNPRGTVYGFEDVISDESSDERFTKQERQELAAYMIELWTQWSNKEV